MARPPLCGLGTHAARGPRGMYTSCRYVPPLAWGSGNYRPGDTPPERAHPPRIAACCCNITGRRGGPTTRRSTVTEAASNWGRARGDGARRRQPRRHRCALRCRQCMAGKSLSVIETSRARRLVRRWTSLNGWHRGTHCDANRNRSCLHPPPVSAAPTSTPSVRRSQISKLTSFGNFICLAVYLLSIYYLLSCTASFGH